MQPDDVLIDLIYASTVGERAWSDVVSALDDGLPDGATLLFSHDANRRGGALIVSHNFDPAWTTAFNEHYSAINPFMPAAAVRPVGKGVVADEMCAREELKRTEFYNDFLAPSASLPPSASPSCAKPGDLCCSLRRRQRIILISFAPMPTG